MSASPGIGMTSDRTRGRMVEVLRKSGITDERVLAAMLEIPRHVFVEAGIASRAYEDTPLPIGHGQTISSPTYVALMTQLLLEKGPVAKVLEIGTGCGYQTAILARLVKEVYTLERIAPLMDKARRHLRDRASTTCASSMPTATRAIPRADPTTASSAPLPRVMCRRLSGNSWPWAGVS